MAVKIDVVTACFPKCIILRYFERLFISTPILTKIIQSLDLFTTFVVLTGPFCPLFSAGQTFVATSMGVTTKDMTPEISTSLEEAHLKEEELLTARGFQSPGASWMDGCFPICFLVKQIGALLKGVLKRSHFNLIPMSWIQLLRWRSDLTAMMAVMSATFTKRAPDVAGSLGRQTILLRCI